MICGGLWWSVVFRLTRSVLPVNYFVFRFLVFDAECNKLPILGILPYCIFPAVILFKF